jgi:CheY-like chemotaxis protein
MAADFSNMRILVVDDQTLVRTLVSQAVRSLGFRSESIQQGFDGNNALHILAVRQVDIVLCDIQMQPLNGLDLLKALRSGRTANPPNLPFVFLSAHPDRSNILTAAKLHADGFIVKPPKPADIEKNLDAAFARKRPPIDPFSYIPVPTGSDYDATTFGLCLQAEQSRDLDALLALNASDVALDEAKPESLLARDLVTPDGVRLLPRGIHVSSMQLKILRDYRTLYRIDTLPVAALSAKELHLMSRLFGG